MIGIYKITNTINNKVYIGQSINIQKRWSSHRTKPFNKNSNTYDLPLYRAIRKYGLSNFIFEVIEECEADKLNEKEQFYIQKYKANDSNFGYNLTMGGSTATVPSKLTEADVEEIYNLLLNTSLTEAEIAIQFNISQRLVSGINLGQYHILPNISYPLRNKVHYFCLDCGKEISKGAKRCVACANTLKNKSRISKNKPSREILKAEIRSESFVSLGKKYGVSDNAIKKWCISYNLPSKKSIIKTYTDEEWSKI